MIFYFFRYWLTLAMRAWFKRAYVHYEEPLPDDGPIIFASTHPNSAIDYLFGPIIHRQRTHVLVRGDVFQKPLLNRIFRMIYMLPVYRFRDGYASLNRNQQSFKECFRHFDNNGKVLIFSEGICIQEKSLQPLQKGTARLAIDYITKHGGEKMYVVPLATSYSRFRFFRSTAMVNYGKAIDARDYIERYNENPNRAYEALTSEIATSLKENYITQDNYSDTGLTEQALMVLRLNRFDTRAGWAIRDRTFFDEEKRLADYLNDHGHEVLGDDWKHQIDKIGINARQEGVLAHPHKKWLLGLRMMVLWPFMALSFATVAMPYGVSRWLIKTKIKDKIFDNTVTILGSAVLYILQFGILVLIAVMVWGVPGLLLPAMVLLITLMGIELVDDFLFAYNNWNNTNIDGLTQIHSRVKVLTRA